MPKNNVSVVRVGNSEAHIWNRDALALTRSIPDDSVDLVISSPPYCMGMPYETSVSELDFVKLHRRLLPKLEKILKPGGSICWQVGHHVRDGRVIPLDALVYRAACEKTDLVLRNRVVWTFGHGAHSRRRFSGRHETVLWFTKGNDYHFDLDAVRVPQKYPGKRAYKGARKGEFSGNPAGKNPGDVWDIPNVKAHHPEKTSHPCQFPVALAQRFVRSLTRPGEMVFDPFMGSGTTGVAALSLGRDFIGSETQRDYVTVAVDRMTRLGGGVLKVRPDHPPRDPRPTEAVAMKPPHFADAAALSVLEN
jgi:adenine-specific DNA-methyltransferase